MTSSKKILTAAGLMLVINTSVSAQFVSMPGVITEIPGGGRQTIAPIGDGAPSSALHFGQLPQPVFAHPIAREPGPHRFLPVAPWPGPGPTPFPRPVPEGLKPFVSPSGLGGFQPLSGSGR